MDELTQRLHRAAESILENESLTADLDDAAARVLLDWGMACVEIIVQSTRGLSDPEAKKAISPRLQATRQLMRLVTQWVVRSPKKDPQAGSARLDEIIESASIIYAGNFTSPDYRQRDMFFTQRLTDDPAHMIAHLRQLIEGSFPTASQHIEKVSDG